MRRLKSIRRQKIYKETTNQKEKVEKIGKVCLKYMGPTMSSS